MEADGSIQGSRPDTAQETQPEVMSPSLVFDAQPWGRPGFPSRPPSPEDQEASWVNEKNVLTGYRLEFPFFTENELTTVDS